MKTKEWVREEIIEGSYGSSCAFCQEQMYLLVDLAISESYSMVNNMTISKT